MTTKSYSVLLRELAKAYYNHQLVFDDYRARRREILHKIDASFNRRVIIDTGRYENDITRRSNQAQAGQNSESLRLGDTLTMPVLDVDVIGAIKNKM